MPTDEIEGIGAQPVRSLDRCSSDAPPSRLLRGTWLQGYKQGEARRALDAVLRSCKCSHDSISHVGAGGPELTAESLIRKALHHLLPKAMRTASTNAASA